MTTFTWSIPANGVLTQNIDNHENTVVLVRYLVTATDGVNTVEKLGVARLTFDPTQPFIPFADLTEAQVLAWVKTEQTVATVQGELTKQLERLANPPARPEIKPLPWVTGTPSNIQTCVQA
jgi:hypothetical protein